MSYPVVAADPGVTRQILAEAEPLMVVAFRFEEGAEGKLHDHPHVQSTYVESGKFRFHLDGQDHDLAAGDSLIIPSGARHGCVCMAAGTLIDTFTPRRDDFL
ncbi:cupin domain-containing protein [Flavimaricola marinus]|uniref:Cupin domain protein n=1 Tax=Flavimaricola marinus TaxID=1819565 RepID=A0A238LC01_9RHOB|nr:cupin domain-containing protein [Flavimaricola marinus]SMY06934.1 Cupin domain protein [Flavimaricola marinus]